MAAEQRPDANGDFHGRAFDRSRTDEGLSHRDSGRGGHTSRGRIDGTPLGGILPFPVSIQGRALLDVNAAEPPGSANGSSNSATSEAARWSSPMRLPPPRAPRAPWPTAPPATGGGSAARPGRPGPWRRCRRARGRGDRDLDAVPTRNGRRFNSDRRAAISPAKGWTAASSGRCRSAGPREELGDTPATGRGRVADAERPPGAALDERDPSSGDGRETIALVKGSFRRPFRVGETVLPSGGGRVTELLARPLLNLHRPELAGFVQPLAGEIAARRSLLERLPFPVGYGVEIAMLLDAHERVGIDAMAQADLGERQNRHQSLRRAVGHGARGARGGGAAHRRARPRPLRGGRTLPLPFADPGVRRIDVQERPPLVR